MKCFLDSCRPAHIARACAGCAVLAIAGRTLGAPASCHPGFATSKPRARWRRVFFRMMSLPGGAVLFRRPPRETRPALARTDQDAASQCRAVFSARAGRRAATRLRRRRIRLEVLRREFFGQDRRPVCAGRFLSSPAAARSMKSRRSRWSRTLRPSPRRNSRLPHSSVPGRRSSASSA